MVRLNKRGNKVWKDRTIEETKLGKTEQKEKQNFVRPNKSRNKLFQDSTRGETKLGRTEQQLQLKPCSETLSEQETLSGLRSIKKSYLLKVLLLVNGYCTNKYQKASDPASSRH